MAILVLIDWHSSFDISSNYCAAEFNGHNGFGGGAVSVMHEKPTKQLQDGVHVVSRSRVGIGKRQPFGRISHSVIAAFEIQWIADIKEGITLNFFWEWEKTRENDETPAVSEI